ncbi:hypothetical protein ACWEO4_39745 [Streptomyces sp. NPDC004393]
MRRIVLLVPFVLLATACNNGEATPTADGGKSAGSSHSAAASKSSARSAAKPKASASSKDCPPTRDIIVWSKVPDVPAGAQELGNYNSLTCESTFKWLEQTSPKEAGDCLQAAWASDNPGYNVDAEPAKRLKKVQVSVGPAC